MPKQNRGEVWLVDLGMVAKVRKLVLEMVVDNNFSNEIIRLQRGSVERDEQWIAALKAEGKDPNGQYFRFIFIPTE